MFEEVFPVFFIAGDPSALHPQYFSLLVQSNLTARSTQAGSWCVHGNLVIQVAILKKSYPGYQQLSIDIFSVPDAVTILNFPEANKCFW